jgi:hypothetical protein
MPEFIKFDLESAEEYVLFIGHEVFTKKRLILLLNLHGQQFMNAAGMFLEKYQYYAYKVTDFKKKHKQIAISIRFISFYTFTPYVVLLT